MATADGSALLALLALTLWSLAASRPGRFAAWIEGSLGALAWAWICSWAALVYEGTLLFIGPGLGLYTALSGWMLRALRRRCPLALAAPAAWLFVETLRLVIPLPLGFAWMRLGTHLNALPWLAGSARVWGFGGLGLVLASCAGLAAQVAGRERPGVLALSAGLVPLVLAAAFSRAIPAPRTVDGPTVLLVQPGFPQERKMRAPDRSELFAELVELTRKGLAEERAGAPIDLVCWGETMLPTFVVDPELPRAVEQGARFAPWVEVEWSGDDFQRAHDWQRSWVDGVLFGSAGRTAVLPPGSAFLSGAERLTVRGGVVRRQNAVLLWTGPGEPVGAVTKRFLVPSAETMYGLERFALVRAVVLELAGYLPDLDSDPGAPRTLAFPSSSGRTFRFSAAVCFDNAFDAPFTAPLRAGPLDFHLVVSNEAWFRRSLEFDQMIAFSRLEALATGRAIVRATNSGVSCVIAPDGRELARLVAQGRDRDVGGTLRATVPVPASEVEAGRLTPFVRWEHGWTTLWLAGPLVLLLGRRGRRARDEIQAASNRAPTRG